MKIYTVFEIPNREGINKKLVIKRLRTDTVGKFTAKGYKHLFDIKAKTRKDALLTARRMAVGGKQ